MNQRTLIILVCCLFLPYCNKPNTLQSLTLNKGEPSSFPSPGPLIHDFLLTCEQGVIEDIVVVQLGVDISMELRNSRNETILTWDSPYSHHGTERILFKPDYTGAFFLRLSATNPNQKGTYQIKRRHATADANKRLQAFEKQYAGEERLHSDATQGLAELEGAQRIWLNLDEPAYLQASMLAWRLALHHQKKNAMGRAIEAYDEALAHLERTEASALEPIVYYYKGDVHYKMGHVQTAIAHFNKALAYKTLALENRADILLYLGKAYVELNNTQKARPCLQQALELNKQGDRPAEMANTLGSLGWLAHTEKNYRLALEHYENALNISRPYHLDNITGIILQYKAKTHQAFGDHDLSLSYLLEASVLQGASINLKVNIAENLLNRTNYNEAKGALEELLPRFSNQPPSLAYLRFLLARAEMGLGNPHKAKDLMKKVLPETQTLGQQMGTRRQRLNFKAQRFQENRFFLDVMVADTQDPHALDAFQFAAQARMAMLSPFELQPGRTDQRLNEEARKLADTINEMAFQQKQPETETLRIYQERYETLLDTLWQNQKLDDLNQEPNWDLRPHLRPHELAVYIAMGIDHTYMWLFTDKTVHFKKLSMNNKLDALSRDFYTYVKGNTNPGEKVRQIGEDLTHLLFTPFWEHLQGKELIIITDGGLNYLPFETLPVPGKGDMRLLDRFDIRYLNSLRQLTERVTHKGEGDGLLMVANPYFGRDFNKLRYSEKEANGIKALAKKVDIPVDLLMGTEASRDAFLNHKRLHKTSILHLATHGLYMESWPELSALVLSTRDSENKPRAGFLRMQDIYHLNLNARLVVLSACETALGEELPGAGIMGFADAFLATGSQGCIVSLWPVDDAATMALMTRFYENYLTKKQQPATALSEAKRWLSAQEPFKAPTYWAGFIYQGQ